MPFILAVRRGEAHPRSKMSNQTRLACRERWISKEASIAELARENHVAFATMRRVVQDPTLKYFLAFQKKKSKG